ncbi:MAG: transcriptional initiation protein Tat, partial [Acidobacteriota bacterium]
MKHWGGFIVLASLILAPVIIQADPSVYPLGTTIYKPDKCWNGFTILSSEEGRLIDMNGNLVHLWKGKLH